MLGERPPIDAERRKAFDVRAALERRFGDAPNDHGEGAVTAEVADGYVEAVRQKDGKAQAVYERAIHEINGPPRQGIDLTARVYSVVNIIGDDDDDEDEVA